MNRQRWITVITVLGIALMVNGLLSLSLPSQTVNMGRTFLAPGAVRYANEAGTGTTLHKLAKLTGAPSTAIITATGDTSGIVGIVVAGAGTAGSADIAVFGKASCVFDSATTAGHYVQNDTSTAGDCMDAGATYPTTGQVIGIVISTNGGAGTYEVDLSLGQPQAGGAGGGATIGSGAYAALPALCNAGDAYIPTDSAYDILRCNPANTWNHYRDGQLLIPPVLADFAWINQGAATAVNTYGGVYVTSPAGAGTNLRILKKAAPATPYTITAAVLPNYMAIDFHGGGILFRKSGTGTLAALEIGHDNNDFQYHSMKFTNPTTFSAFYTTQAARYLPALVWLQISDDGVNRISRFSLNGKDFFTLHTVGRTDFLTADEVGLWNDSNNATYGTNLWVIHWVQS